jgi:hypothetical protein
MKCAKRAYRDEIAAKVAMARIAQVGEAREKAPARSYRCPRCHRWHLTSKR